MATRYTTIGGTLAALTAIGITIGTAADAPAVRTAISAAAVVTTTRGDMIRRGASADERVAIGASGTVLTSNGTDPVWAGAPATLADQQRADALRRRGPLAMRSTGVQGTSASTTTDSTPSILKSTSGVITLYSPQAGGYGSAAFAASGVAATRGWYMSGFDSTFRIGLTLAVVQPIDFTTFLGSVGWHSLAWAIAADGNSVRYSIDGAAAATLVPASIPLAPVARNAADAVYIGNNGSSTGTTPAGLAYLAFWESILSDADLVAASSSPSAGAPSLPSTPAWEWAASAFGNANAAVRIDGTDHAVLSTPAWWMP